MYAHDVIFCSPAPSAPTNVTAHNVSSMSVMVTWEPPITPNGIVRFYRVEYPSITDVVDQTFSGNSGDGINEIFTTNTSVIITMLERFTTYEVQVFATTIAEGYGSDVVTVTTDEDSKNIIVIYVYIYVTGSGKTGLICTSNYWYSFIHIFTSKYVWLPTEICNFYGTMLGLSYINILCL